MSRVPLLLLLAVGCSPEHRPRRPESPVWSDVAPIVADRCGSCHQDGGISGLPLTTWREVHGARDVVGYVIEERLMPPWPAVEADYPLQSDPSLSDEERALIADWVAADAPRGDADPDEPLAPPSQASLPQVDAVLSSPSEYQPRASLEDDYRCLVMEPSGPVEGYMRGYEFVVGNPSVIHHAKLVAVYPRDGGATLAAQEALDPEPGFACDDAVQTRLGGPSSRLATWLPGKEVTVFPEGTGVRIRPGAVFVLSVHYHPQGSNGLSDQTSVALTLSPTVERVADVTYLQNRRWSRSPDEGGLVVPAGDEQATFKWTSPVSKLAIGAFDADSVGVDLLSAAFHMHGLGQRGRLVVTVDGEERTLLDIPRWDIDWQYEYWPVEPIHLGPDDELSIRCVYDNGVGESDVPWGEATEDEMCVAMLNVLAPAEAP